MQKLLRTLVFILILGLVGSVVFTQTNLLGSLRHPVALARNVLSKAQQKVAEIAHGSEPEVTPAPVPSAPAVPPVHTPAAAAAPEAMPVRGTEASPVMVRILPGAEEAGEREKDRDIQVAIEKHLSALSRNSQIGEYLLIFIAGLYFVSLVLIAWLIEVVRKTAETAGKAAEAAKQSAASAEDAFNRNIEKEATRKFPPHFYRKR